MKIEEIQGYDQFINSCPPTSRIFLNEYFSIIEENLKNPHVKDKNRPGAFDWHHIIPVSMGGKNAPKVLLEFKDHVLAHFYLFKAFRNKEMAYAFNMLSNRTSSKEFEQFLENDQNELLNGLQEAREIFGEHRRYLAKEYWKNNRHPTRGKTGDQHPCFGRVVVNRDGVNRKILPEELSEYESDGWQIGFTEGIYKYEREKRIFVNNGDDEKTIPESELSIYLSTGWKLGRHPDNTSMFVGKSRYATPDGVFYAMLNSNDPQIQKLGLIHHKTDASRNAVIASQKLAVQANLGSKVYNNGTIQKRFKEDPGEEWILGEIQISDEIKKKRADACSVACKGTIIYNDGIRNYRLKPEEVPESHWKRGMAPQKKRKPRV